MLQDLILNLVSETIGILVTVLIINRLLKRREEKRWLPLKQFVYAKLLEMTGCLLQCILPSRFVKLTNIVYEYGVVSSYPQVEISTSFDELTMTDLLSEIDKDIQFEKRLDVEFIGKSKQQLDDILSKSAFLLEPELLGLLLELDRPLTALSKLEPNWQDKRSRWDLVLCLTQIVLTASDLKTWLAEKASRTILTEATTGELLQKTHHLKSKLQTSVHGYRRIRF